MTDGERKLIEASTTEGATAILAALAKLGPNSDPAARRMVVRDELRALLTRVLRAKDAEGP